MTSPNTKTIIIVVIALLVTAVAGVLVWTNYDISLTKKTVKPIALPPQNSDGTTLTELEAKTIAEQSCIKGGEALSAGSYNQNTRTWWFDANLNATREGCNPACVVSEETKTAEINWRCTGLNEPDSKPCGIENCHGLDIICGPKPAQMCTMMYALGDKCRQYAKCGVVNGECRQIENTQFTACKSCVEKCEKNYQNDPYKVFACERECGE